MTPTPTTDESLGDKLETKTLALQVPSPEVMQKFAEANQKEKRAKLQQQANDEARKTIEKLRTQLAKGKTVASVELTSRSEIRKEVGRLVVAAFAAAGWAVTSAYGYEGISVEYPDLDPPHRE